MFAPRAQGLACLEQLRGSWCLADATLAWFWGAAWPCSWCPIADREVKDLQDQGMGAPWQRQIWQCQSKQRVQVRFTVKGKTNY